RSLRLLPSKLQHNMRQLMSSRRAADIRAPTYLVRNTPIRTLRYSLAIALDPLRQFAAHAPTLWLRVYRIACTTRGDTLQRRRPNQNASHEVTMNTRPSASSHEAPAESHERRTQLSRHLGLREDDALLVIDMQCDFLPGGALGVPAGDQVIAPLNSYIDAFAARDLPIFFTRDWHPQNHCSFETAGGRWPPHCVRDTAGAAWAPGLRIPRNARIISKAQEPTA